MMIEDDIIAKEREMQLTEALALIYLTAKNNENDPSVLVKIKELAETALKKPTSEKAAYHR